MSDDKEKRLIELINENVPDVLGDMQPQQIQPVSVARDDGSFPMPNAIWNSTDGGIVPGSWSLIDGYAFRIGSDGGLRWFGTTSQPICRIYPHTRADALAVVIYDPYRMPGQRLSRVLIRYPSLTNVRGLQLSDGSEVLVELTPQFVDTAESA